MFPFEILGLSDKTPNIPDSLFYLLNGCDFSFHHMTGENRELLLLTQFPCF